MAVKDVVCCVFTLEKGTKRVRERRHMPRKYMLGKLSRRSALKMDNACSILRPYYLRCLEIRSPRKYINLDAPAAQLVRYATDINIHSAGVCAADGCQRR